VANVQNILNTASQYLGTGDFNNYCEAFVEQAALGHTGVYPSAIQAWIAQQKSAVQGTQGLQPGDQVFFSADKTNGGYGHTGIYIGNNQFISATYNGVKTEDLSKWQASTGQKLLGYVPSGQQGRGIAQFAMDSGKMLQGQMNQAGNASPEQMAQLLQEQKAQQHIAQSERLMEQAQTYGNQSQYFMQQAQQQPHQQPVSSVSAVQGQQETPNYPYGQYLNQSNQPVQPTNQTATPVNPMPGAQPPPTLPNSTTTDLSKPQTNLNPTKTQGQSYQFGPISATLQ
jgi:hypothetical protein